MKANLGRKPLEPRNLQDECSAFYVENWRKFERRTGSCWWEGFPVNGMPDEVGWLYEVDIGKLRKKRFLHKDMLAALDDDSFSLKKEYGAARECLNNLLDKQRPKGHNFFDRFS